MTRQAPNWDGFRLQKLSRVWLELQRFITTPIRFCSLREGNDCSRVCLSVEGGIPMLVNMYQDQDQAEGRI